MPGVRTVMMQPDHGMPATEKHSGPVSRNKSCWEKSPVVELQSMPIAATYGAKVKPRDACHGSDSTTPDRADFSSASQTCCVCSDSVSQSWSEFSGADQLAECIDQAAFNGRVRHNVLIRSAVGIVNPETRLVGVPWFGEIVADESRVCPGNFHPAPADCVETGFKRCHLIIWKPQDSIHPQINTVRAIEPSQTHVPAFAEASRDSCRCSTSRCQAANHHPDWRRIAGCLQPAHVPET